MKIRCLQLVASISAYVTDKFGMITAIPLQLDPAADGGCGKIHQRHNADGQVGQGIPAVLESVESVGAVGGVDSGLSGVAEGMNQVAHCE